MATFKQIEANRLNARKSTGPQTPSGKAVSRMNALKTGIDAQSTIIRGETAAALETLTGEFYDLHQPTDADQRALVDTLVHSEWLLRRLRRTEAQIWERQFQQYEKSDELNEKTSLAGAFGRHSETFTRLQRRMDSTDRAFHRALRQLERLQAAPRSASPDPQPIDAISTSTQIGFLPPSLSEPAAEPAARAARPLAISWPKHVDSTLPSGNTV